MSSKEHRTFSAEFKAETVLALLFENRVKDRRATRPDEIWASDIRLWTWGAADEYVKLLQSRGVEISMASVGCPEENGFVERWTRTLKEDHVSTSEYDDFYDCPAQIGEFIEEVYQRKRVHSSLGYLPPAVFEERWWETKAWRGSKGDSGDALTNRSSSLPLAGGRVTIPQA